jgi:hypothetical protein
MPEADSGISERKLQAGSFAERSSVVGNRSAANRIVHDNKGSGVGTAGSILPTLPERNRVAVFCSPFYFGNITRQEHLLVVAQGSFLLTGRKISCSYLMLSIHGIPIGFVSAA